MGEYKLKNELLELNHNTIKDKIYIIRNQKVMLDNDLARIYGYTTKTFNQQVQRNIEKFDEDFITSHLDGDQKLINKYTWN